MSLGGVLPALTILATVIAIGCILSAILRRDKGRLAADRLDLPYAVFTREFDVICQGRDVGALLESDGLALENPAHTRIADFSERKAAAEAARIAADGLFVPCAKDWSRAAGKAAIAILVDQSGSMVNRMPELAGQLRALVGTLETAGIPVALLGFTTRGWKGGKAREARASSGRKRYPGRLCALLHIIYKDFGEPLEDEDWQALLFPNALRENVDGEAIEWAGSLLSQRREAERLLIVVSDGAPVDDSSLAENGPSFLWNDLLLKIKETDAIDRLKLGALGIEHNVQEVYRVAEHVEKIEEFPATAITLLNRMLN